MSCEFLLGRCFSFLPRSLSQNGQVEVNKRLRKDFAWEEILLGFFSFAGHCACMVACYELPCASSLEARCASLHKVRFKRLSALVLCISLFIMTLLQLRRNYRNTNIIARLLVHLGQEGVRVNQWESCWSFGCKYIHYRPVSRRVDRLETHLSFILSQGAMFLKNNNRYRRLEYLNAVLFFIGMSISAWLGNDHNSKALIKRGFSLRQAFFWGRYGAFVIVSCLPVLTRTYMHLSLRPKICLGALLAVAPRQEWISMQGHSEMKERLGSSEETA